jgi:hypothetical protein
MDALPIPFFEAQSRFETLDMASLDHELPEVRAFLLAHQSSTGAIDSYAIVRSFLYNFLDSGSYDPYRTHVEKLLSWSICIAAKPLQEFDNNDMLEFLAFCEDPPTDWISPRAHRRFNPVKDHKRGPTLTYSINPDWRPFVGTTSELTDPNANQADELQVAYKTSLIQLISVCRSFFMFMAVEGHISTNPMQETDRSGRFVQPNMDYVERSAFSLIEWEFIANAIDDLVVEDRSHERTLFIVMSAFHLYLKPGDFDKYSRTLKMADFFDDDDGQVWLNLGVSNRGLETVRVPESYIQHLDRYRRYLGTHSIPLSRDYSPVFSAHCGRPGLSRGHVNLLFRNVIERAAVAMERDGYPAVDIESLRSGSFKWVRNTSASVGAQTMPLADLHVDLRNVNIDVTQARYYESLDRQRTK